MRKAPLPPPSRSPVVDAPDQQYLVNAKVLAAGISATFACSSCRKSDSLVPDDVPPASQHHRTSGLGWGLTLRVRCRHCKARHTICLRGDRVAGQAPAEDVEENEQLDRAAKKARRVSFSGEVLRDVIASLLCGLTHAGYSKHCVAQQRKPMAWVTFQRHLLVVGEALQACMAESIGLMRYLVVKHDPNGAGDCHGPLAA